MELRLKSDDGNILRLETVGKISRDGWSARYDPLIEQCGDEVYRNQMLLNLRQSSHIDSTGVEWLIQSHQRCGEAGGRLVVHSPSPMIRDVLNMMRINLVLHLAADETGALKKLSESAPS